MKKKEVILDFTSLLDVIMIILFVVISNMNQASIEVNAAADKTVSEMQSKLEARTEDMDALQEQLNKQLEINMKNENLQAAYDSLEQNYENLQDDYDYLKITSHYQAGDTLVYEQALDRTAKVVLVCDTDNTVSDKPVVLVDVYQDEEEEKSQSLKGSFQIKHDLNLTASNRAKYNADQVTEITKYLADLFRDDQHPLIWFTVQYRYDDADFSNMDMVMIRQAVHNLELTYGKSCRVEEMKLYNTKEEKTNE